jgi:hypothetical protein
LRRAAGGVNFVANENGRLPFSGSRPFLVRPFQMVDLDRFDLLLPVAITFRNR